MRVFVTGGTGAIGGYTVPALVRAGHTVTALARSETKARVLETQGATPALVSLFDREALTAALADCEAVVNLASSLPIDYCVPSAIGMARVRTGAHRRLRRRRGRVPTRGCSEVHSGVGCDDLRRRRRGWIDEDHPVDHYPISRGNHAAEASARRFADAGRCAIVLRFGVFYGRGAAHSEQIVALARRHVGFVPRRGRRLPVLDSSGRRRRGRRRRLELSGRHLQRRRRRTRHQARSRLDVRRGRRCSTVGDGAGTAWASPRRSADVVDPVTSGEQQAVSHGYRLESPLPQRPRRLPRDGLSNCSSLRRWRDLD